jgi:hypothetical protein
MLAFDSNTRAVACRSCGAYGVSQHRPTCQPGRVFTLGRSRRAIRDRRTSAAILTLAEQQRSLVRNL